MIRAGLIGALLALCACGTPDATYRDLDRLGADYERGGESPLGERQDTCHLAQHQTLIGREQSSIRSSDLPQGARVLCFGCMATLDHNPQRLNLQIGQDGKVASLRCG